MLVLGAIGGGYLGLIRDSGNSLAAAVGPGPSSGAAATVDADAATEAARAKAARAAAVAAERAKKAQDLAKRNQQTASRSQPRTTYPVPSSCKEYTGNRALGCALMLDAGYPLAQMPCLEKLWTRESGWNHTSHNASSGAYGIPQAVPGDKMAAYGADWETNPVPQIKWGLNYIKNRYDSPCGAWSFFQTHNWY